MNFSKTKTETLAIMELDNPEYTMIKSRIRSGNNEGEQPEC